MYEQFRRELEEFKAVDEKDKIDVWVVGSDLSVRAIETAEKNIEFAELDELFHHEQFKRADHPRLNNPLIYQAHWPKRRLSLPSTSVAQSQPGGSGELYQANESTYLSLYQGSFEAIGQRLAPITNSFEDFSIISNIPYGI